MKKAIYNCPVCGGLEWALEDENGQMIVSKHINIIGWDIDDGYEVQDCVGSGKRTTAEVLYIAGDIPDWND